MPTLLKVIPPHKTFVEPMAGGAALAFAKPPARVTVLGDIDPGVIGFFKKFSCEAVRKCARQADTCGFSAGAIKRVRAGSASVCDVLAARRFSIASALGGLKAKECSGRSVAPKHVLMKCSDYEKLLRRMKIVQGDFRQVAKRFDGAQTLTYLDPPYHQTTTEYRIKGVSPTEVLALAKSLRGKVLISYNDHPQVRAAAHGKGLYVYRVPTSYPMRAVEGKTGRRTQELLISNFPLKLARR